MSEMIRQTRPKGLLREMSRKECTTETSATRLCGRQCIDLPSGAAKEFPRPGFILETLHGGFECLDFLEGHSR